MSTITVINPNSNETVTRGLEQALRPLERSGGPAIRCLTLQEGPLGIESQRDSDSVVAPLCQLIEREEAGSAAFVIACFSDPGLHAARESTMRPVLGIAEAGITTALNLADRFGIISILHRSLPRHRRYLRMMGVETRLAGDLPIEASVAELADEQSVSARMHQVGQQLVEALGAEVLVLGCAGMARYREPLQEALGVAVIDPTQAAVGMAITAVQLGYKTQYKTQRTPPE